MNSNNIILIYDIFIMANVFFKIAYRVGISVLCYELVKQGHDVSGCDIAKPDFNQDKYIHT